MGSLVKVLLVSFITLFLSLFFGLVFYVILSIMFPSHRFYEPITNFEIYGLCIAVAFSAVVSGFLIGRYTANIKLN